MIFSGPFAVFFNRQFLLSLALYGVMLASACSVVYLKHLSRTLYASIQENTKQRATLNAEWSQLVLEHGAWTTDMRVEQVAKKELEMIVPVKTGVIQP